MGIFMGDVAINRRDFLTALSASATTMLVACGGGGGGGIETQSPPPPPVAPTASRTWKLGFSPNPPRPTTAAVLGGIDRWSLRGELAIIHEELPWQKLLSGMTADSIIDSDKLNLVNYMRGKGLQLVYMGELNDGLSRAEEAPQLRAAGRSITEPAIQQLYRDYMLAVVRKLNPQFVGLAAETNLVRAAAPSALYAAVVKTANDTASAIRAAGGAMPLLSSVQVETAWGVLGTRGPFVGIDIDRRDFPFTQILGLSSYPYLGYADPDDIPADYFTRLVPPNSAPSMLMEGGWPSASVATLASSPEKQARYVTKQAALLDSISARAWLHLLFADADLSTFPQPIPPNLPLFASIGLTDSDFNPKPALAAWDGLFARRLV